jgi:hypothetical protein
LSPEAFIDEAELLCDTPERADKTEQQSSYCSLNEVLHLEKQAALAKTISGKDETMDTATSDEESKDDDDKMSVGGEDPPIQDGVASLENIAVPSSDANLLDNTVKTVTIANSTSTLTVTPSSINETILNNNVKVPVAIEPDNDKYKVSYLQQFGCACKMMEEVFNTNAISNDELWKQTRFANQYVIREFLKLGAIKFVNCPEHGQRYCIQPVWHEDHTVMLNTFYTNINDIKPAPIVDQPEKQQAVLGLNQYNCYHKVYSRVPNEDDMKSFVEMTKPEKLKGRLSRDVNDTVHVAIIRWLKQVYVPSLPYVDNTDKKSNSSTPPRIEKRPRPSSSASSFDDKPPVKQPTKPVFTTTQRRGSTVGNSGRSYAQTADSRISHYRKEYPAMRNTGSKLNNDSDSVNDLLVLNENNVATISNANAKPTIPFVSDYRQERRQETSPYQMPPNKCAPMCPAGYEPIPSSSNVQDTDYRYALPAPVTDRYWGTHPHPQFDSRQIAAALATPPRAQVAAQPIAQQNNVMVPQIEHRLPLIKKAKNVHVTIDYKEVGYFHPMRTYYDDSTAPTGPINRTLLRDYWLNEIETTDPYSRIATAQFKMHRCFGWGLVGDSNLRNTIHQYFQETTADNMEFGRHGVGYMRAGFAWTNLDHLFTNHPLELTIEKMIISVGNVDIDGNLDPLTIFNTATNVIKRLFERNTHLKALIITTACPIPKYFSNAKYNHYEHKEIRFARRRMYEFNQRLFELHLNKDFCDKRVVVLNMAQFFMDGKYPATREVDYQYFCDDYSHLSKAGIIRFYTVLAHYANYWSKKFGLSVKREVRQTDFS